MNKSILITFSAGVTQCNPGELQESITERADDAMYRAKKNGKKQITVAEEKNWVKSIAKLTSKL